MNSFLAAKTLPLVYAITDRSRLRTANQTQAPVLISFIEQLVNAGIDMVQIRERDLAARQLVSLAEGARACALGKQSAILVNDRADVAASTGIGVHLATRSLDVGTVRKTFGGDLFIGVSTHNEDEIRSAEDNGADFVVLGPVFDTPTKREYGSPIGLQAFERISSVVSLPVLGLGGVTLGNFRSVLEAGAAGIAGISMFSDTDDLPATVATIKSSLSIRRS